MHSPGDSIDVDAVTVMEHGYEAQFLCELESKLMCPICLLIMSNAVQTLCGHRFCEACIKRVIVDGSAILTCPMDRSISKVEQIFPDVAIRREILCLPIKCTNSTEGCTWRGELIEMPNHQSTCGFECVPCTHGCGTRIRRSEMDQHMTQCPSRQVPCLFCCERVPHSKMISHTEQCPKAPVTCSMCGKDDLLRDELSSHQDIDSGSCPKSIIHCPYSYTGCTYKAERSKIQEHITENGTLGKHMDFVARKLNEKRNIIRHLHKKSTNALMDVQTLTAQLKDLKTQLLDAHNETLNKDKDLLVIKSQLEDERKKWHEKTLELEDQKNELTKQLKALKADSQNKRHACDVATVSSAANDVVLGYSLRSKAEDSGITGGSLAGGQEAIPTVLSKPKARKKAWTEEETNRLKEIIKTTGPDFKRILKEFQTTRTMKSVRLKVVRILSKDKTLTRGHT